MATQVVNLLHYRSLNLGQVPANLEFGGFAVNTYNGIYPTVPTLREVYLFVGTGGNDRVDEQGNDLSSMVAVGEPLVSQKGWVRFNLRSMKTSGDTMTGDLVMSGARIRFEVGSAGNAELILPDQTVASTATLPGSVRYNALSSKVEYWDGSIWSFLSSTDFQTATGSVPATRGDGVSTLQNGDRWFDNSTTEPFLSFWDGTQWIKTTDGGVY